MSVKGALYNKTVLTLALLYEYRTSKAQHTHKTNIVEMHMLK